LAVFKRTVRRPQLRHRDRLFWMVLANVSMANCQSCPKDERTNL
jgi:hypothetical protein